MSSFSLQIDKHLLFFMYFFEGKKKTEIIREIMGGVEDILKSDFRKNVGTLVFSLCVTTSPAMDRKEIGKNESKS